MEYLLFERLSLSLLLALVTRLQLAHVLLVLLHQSPELLLAQRLSVHQHLAVELLLLAVQCLQQVRA